MAEIKALNDELNNLILQGKAMDAFEKFYADNIVMVENFDEPCEGKDANRKREEEFFSNVEQFHKAEILASAVSGDVSFAEMSFDATYKGGARAQMTEVAVRRWKNGQVVHERFYYKPPA